MHSANAVISYPLTIAKGDQEQMAFRQELIQTNCRESHVKFDILRNLNLTYYGKKGERDFLEPGSGVHRNCGCQRVSVSAPLAFLGVPWPALPSSCSSYGFSL